MNFSVILQLSAIFYDREVDAGSGLNFIPSPSPVGRLTRSELDAAEKLAKRVNKSFSLFYNKVNKLLNKHVPFKPISKRKKKEIIKTLGEKGDQEID